LQDTKFTVDTHTAARLVANHNPNFERSRAPAGGLPAGGMMGMMMDPENRQLVEHMFDGLNDISDQKGQLYTEDDVDHPSVRTRGDTDTQSHSHTDTQAGRQVT